MAKSRISSLLSKILHTVLPFGDYIWILQKEEYDTDRYFRWMPRFFFRRNFLVSETLVMTGRAKVLYVLSVLIWLLNVGVICVIGNGLAFKAGLFILLLVLIPLIVLVSSVVSIPFFMAAHYSLQQRARDFVAGHEGLRIIAIAGSYGKTTTKNFIYDLVRYHFRTQMVPGNINTPTGIAAWLLSNLNSGTEVLVLEMDAYKRGEIRASSRITPPDIAVITNVGDQHLERFGSKHALALALGELVTYAKPQATVIADAVTLDALRDSIGMHPNVRVDTTKLLYQNHSLTADHLSHSNQENLARALAAVEVLEVPASFVEHLSAELLLPDQRQKHTQMFGYECVDDSYNISLSSAKAGIAAAHELAHAKGKKLLVVTAGIPELGPENLKGNRKLGEVITVAADHAVVLQSIFAKDIEQGIGDTTKFSQYKRQHDFFAESHEKFPPDEWLLLVQPALPDLYY